MSTAAITIRNHADTGGSAPAFADVRMVTLRGATFACRVTGRGEPLVLVHAALSDMRSWEPIEPILADRFCVVNYSRRYAHPNRPAQDATCDDFAGHVDDLIALIETLDLGAVHLVGNSSGAFIALMLARRRPELVRTLTLEEPPVVSMFLPTLPPRIGDVFACLLDAPLALLGMLRFGALAVSPAIAAFRAGADAAAVDRFARGVLGRAALDALSDARRAQMLDNAKAHRAALLGAGLPVFTAGDAAAVAVPTQLVHGSRTPGFQRRINQRLAELIPGAREVRVAGASHFVHEDRPREVAGAIVAWCRRHAG